MSVLWSDTQTYYQMHWFHSVVYWFQVEMFLTYHKIMNNIDNHNIILPVVHNFHIVIKIKGFILIATLIYLGIFMIDIIRYLSIYNPHQTYCVMKPLKHMVDYRESLGIFKFLRSLWWHRLKCYLVWTIKYIYLCNMNLDISTFLDTIVDEVATYTMDFRKVIVVVSFH